MTYECMETMKNTKPLNLLLASLLLAAVAGTVGCGSSNAIDHTGEKERVAAAKSVRKIFDDAKGNWDAVPPADLADFIKQSGGELNARAAWAGMKDGPGAAQAVMREGLKKQAAAGVTPPSGG